jgi:hypothetical protein
MYEYPYPTILEIIEDIEQNRKKEFIFKIKNLTDFIVYAKRTYDILTLPQLIKVSFEIDTETQQALIYTFRYLAKKYNFKFDEKLIKQVNKYLSEIKKFNEIKELILNSLYYSREAERIFNNFKK